MAKRIVLFGTLGGLIALALFYLFWGALLGIAREAPEDVSEWCLLLCAVVVPAVFAVQHEWEVSDQLGDWLRFIGLFLLCCIGANMSGFAIGSVVLFFESIITGDTETTITLLGLFATLIFIGAPGGRITVWVFELD